LLINQVGKFVKLPFAEQRLLIEATLLLAMARLALLLLPFRWLAPGLGRERSESPEEIPPAHAERARQVGLTVARMSRHVFWKAACLAQAITVQWMLKQRRISSTLYLGMAKDGGKFLAHAWVRSGRDIVSGQAVHQQFKVVSTFAVVTQQVAELAPGSTGR
jgi:hypothetical protein